MSGLVFLDFDKTIISIDAGPQFGQWMFQRRRHATRRHGKAKGAAMRAGMVARLTPYIGWMAVQSALYRARAVRRSTIVRNAYKGLKGVPVGPLEELLAEFVDDYVVPSIYPEVKAEMEEHLRQGRRCIIITTGMRRLVQHCLPHLPSGTDLIGCELEEQDGRLTGGIISGPLYGADKANIVLAYCQANGVDPADCYAYTDHYSDKHMLEAVGHGVCINPRSRLTSLAQREGWRILRPQDPRERREEESIPA